MRRYFSTHVQKEPELKKLKLPTVATVSEKSSLSIYAPHRKRNLEFLVVSRGGIGAGVRGGVTSGKVSRKTCFILEESSWAGVPLGPAAQM